MCQTCQALLILCQHYDIVQIAIATAIAIAVATAVATAIATATATAVTIAVAITVATTNRHSPRQPYALPLQLAMQIRKCDAQRAAILYTHPWALLANGRKEDVTGMLALGASVPCTIAMHPGHCKNSRRLCRHNYCMHPGEYKNPRTADLSGTLPRAGPQGDDAPCTIITAPPCISYANVHNYYGPYAYCSLDKGVACAQHIQLPTYTVASHMY